MIKQKIKNLYRRLVIRYLSNQSDLQKDDWSVADSVEFEEFRDWVDKTITYEIRTVWLVPSNVKHKWVGAQFYHGKIYAIPNDETRILCYDSAVSYIGYTSDGLFKWTGGCVWNDAVYCFPRTANSFLKINEIGLEEIPLTYKYKNEHHYSGVCTSDGIVYQPPRNTNHILKTFLNTGVSNRIDIVDRKYNVAFRYCGSIIHPNGFIYFFPEGNERVIKLDHETDKWCFIGDKVSTMCFDAKVGLDGNIYGFSAYSRGIMKIDVLNDAVQMIHEEIEPGAYGTKYGIDGYLYSVPGDGSVIYRYDVETDELEAFFDLRDKEKAKFAGGSICSRGEIIFIPATRDSLVKLQPDRMRDIPLALMKSFFTDFY